ncbi:FAD-dependent oxidoreductase [Nonomuraea ferruginea]
MKTLAEAVYLRDHSIAQLELAASSNDPEERAARCGFVVVGASYSGVETAATLQLVTRRAMARFPRLDPGLLRWTLIDIAPKVMPELGPELGAAATRLLEERGVEVRLGVTLDRITVDTAKLTDGTTLPSRTVIWTAGGDAQAGGVQPRHRDGQGPPGRGRRSEGAGLRRRVRAGRRRGGARPDGRAGDALRADRAARPPAGEDRGAERAGGPARRQAA